MSSRTIDPGGSGQVITEDRVSSVDRLEATLASDRYARPALRPLVRVEGPFQDKKVWVVSPPAARLHVGQPAFALPSVWPATWGRIRGRRIEGVDVKTVEPGGSQDVGVEFDFPAARKTEVYVLDGPDDGV